MWPTRQLGSSSFTGLLYIARRVRPGYSLYASSGYEIRAEGEAAASIHYCRPKPDMDLYSHL